MSIPPTAPKLCLHFGCIGSPGHYATAPDRSMIDPSLKEWMRNMDGQLHTGRNDRWLTHHFEVADGTHITFIAKRDNSVDTRPGSWCGFLMPGKLPMELALVTAQAAWPQLLVWSTKEKK